MAKFYSVQSWLVVPSRGSEYLLQNTSGVGDGGWEGLELAEGQRYIGEKIPGCC